MTFLNVINNVLRRLREDEVTTWNENDYSTMIGDFVNDALAMCQSAHNWSAQFTEIDISTVASQQGYELDGLGQMGQIYDAYDDTNNAKLIQVSRANLKLQTDMGSGSTEGPPTKFAFNSVGTDDDPTIEVWPIPDAVYTLRFQVKQEQDAMSADATELVIPEQPVIQYALVLAKEEKGELGGNSTEVAFAKARRVLTDYIALDMERNPDLAIWTVD